jgi:hypothetical protein
MKNENMKALFILLGTAVIILSCCFLSFYVAIKPTPSRSQLCKDLSEFIERTKCLDLDATYTVLEAAFPPYQTTREEVRNALGNYYFDSDEASYGSRDYYELDRTVLGEFLIQEAYGFNFDTEEKLLDIRYYD